MNKIQFVATLALLSCCLCEYPACFNKPCPFTIPNELKNEKERKDFIKLLEETTCDLNDIQAEYIQGVLFENYKHEINPFRKSLEKIFLSKISDFVGFQSIELELNGGNYKNSVIEALKKMRAKQCDTKKTINNVIQRMNEKPGELEEFFSDFCETFSLVDLSSKIEISEFEKLMHEYIDKMHFTMAFQDSSEQFAYAFTPLANLLVGLSRKEAIKLIENF